MPILSSKEVADEALYRAKEIIDEMLAERPDIRATLAELGRLVTVAADEEVLTDIPEFRRIYETNPGTDWNPRHQGGGVSGNERDRTTVIWEGNLLCHQNDLFPFEDIFVHEFAHAILNHGVERQEDGREFKRRLEAAYRDALDAGLWEYTYAAENVEEYWAEGVQSWFGVNDPPGPIHNNINTRAELDAYDPTLATLIREVFGDIAVTSSCHETSDVNSFRIRGVITGPDGKPLEGIGIWAWQGQVANSGYSRTGADGVFVIRVPDGSFTLDIWAGEGCSWVGWHDGTGGLATIRSEAAMVHVTGVDVTGIEIRLPDHPANLPRVERCE